jgi:hypothetical protein
VPGIDQVGDHSAQLGCGDGGRVVTRCQRFGQPCICGTTRLGSAASALHFLAFLDIGAERTVDGNAPASKPLTGKYSAQFGGELGEAARRTAE